MTILAALHEGINTLHRAWAGQFFVSPHNPKLEAQALLAAVLKQNTAYLLAHASDELTEEHLAHFTELIRRRAKGEPYAYLTGQKMFGNEWLKVTNATLIPRPETEELVALVLEQRPKEKRFADIGTGSGAIATALAKGRPGSLVFATDASPAALDVAKSNATALGVSEQIHFLHDDLLTPLVEERGDWLKKSGAESLTIVANLPYLSDNQWAVLDPDVKDFEPKTALVGTDADGFGLYRKLFSTLAAYRTRLPSDLYIAVEMDPSQGELFLRTCAQYLPDGQTEVLLDAAGRIRFGTWHALRSK